MSGILFLLEVVAFVVVVWWAYVRSMAGGPGPDSGWLAMRSASTDASDPGRDEASASPRGPKGRATGPRWKGPRG